MILIVITGIFNAILIGILWRNVRSHILCNAIDKAASPGDNGS